MSRCAPGQKGRLVYHGHAVHYAVSHLAQLLLPALHHSPRIKAVWICFREDMIDNSPNSATTFVLIRTLNLILGIAYIILLPSTLPVVLH